jgi:hypothetical protein
MSQLAYPNQWVGSYKKPLPKATDWQPRLCNGLRTSGLAFSLFGRIRSVIALANNPRRRAFTLTNPLAYDSALSLR